MQDPNWIDPATGLAPPLASTAAAVAAADGMPRLTDHRVKVYAQRSHEQLLKDISNLADAQYDLSGRLRRERDAADKKLLLAETSLRFANLKIWILTGLVTVECVVIGWIVELVSK